MNFQTSRGGKFEGIFLLGILGLRGLIFGLRRLIFCLRGLIYSLRGLIMAL